MPPGPVAHLFMTPSAATAHVVRATEALFVEGAEVLVRSGVDGGFGGGALAGVLALSSTLKLHSLL